MRRARCAQSSFFFIISLNISGWTSGSLHLFSIAAGWQKLLSSFGIKSLTFVWSWIVGYIYLNLLSYFICLISILKFYDSFYFLFLFLIICCFFLIFAFSYFLFLFLNSVFCFIFHFCILLLVLLFVFLFYFLFYFCILVGRVFANGLGDMGSILCCVIPKTLKMVLDTSFLNTQQYKVCIKGKVEHSRERSSTLPYTSV